MTKQFSLPRPAIQLHILVSPQLYWRREYGKRPRRRGRENKAPSPDSTGGLENRQRPSHVSTPLGSPTTPPCAQLPLFLFSTRQVFSMYSGSPLLVTCDAW